MCLGNSRQAGCGPSSLTGRTTPGVHGIHDLRTRRLGDHVQVDVHLEIDGTLTVREGHDIAAAARDRVVKNHPVLDVMTHIDPVEPATGLAARQG